MMKAASRLHIALFLVCLAGMHSVQADEVIYKYRMSDGGIAYTQDRSGPGEPDDILRIPSSPPARSPREIQQELQKDKLQVERLAAARRAAEARENRIAQATQAVHLAEMAVANGSEPLPGERQANVNGTSRLTDDYWRRIAALQLSLEIARSRLDQMLRETGE